MELASTTIKDLGFGKSKSKSSAPLRGCRGLWKTVGMPRAGHSLMASRKVDAGLHDRFDLQAARLKSADLQSLITIPSSAAVSRVRATGRSEDEGEQGQAGSGQSEWVNRAGSGRSGRAIEPGQAGPGRSVRGGSGRSVNHSADLRASTGQRVGSWLIGSQTEWANGPPISTRVALFQPGRAQSSPSRFPPSTLFLKSGSRRSTRANFP